MNQKNYFCKLESEVKTKLPEIRLGDVQDTVKRIEREIQDIKRKLDSIELKINDIQRGRPDPKNHI